MKELNRDQAAAILARLFPARWPERPRDRPETLAEQIARQHHITVAEAEKALDEHGF